MCKPSVSCKSAQIRCLKFRGLKVEEKRELHLKEIRLVMSQDLKKQKQKPTINYMFPWDVLLQAIGTH